MTFGETLAALRREKDYTQGDLAKKLYVTRQAVSRWENDETMPGIDMAKLIATVLDVPIARLLEMPEYRVCQSCGMPLTDPAEIGTEADGTPCHDYCKHCYSQGAYCYDATMDELIEGCAPFMAQHTGMSLDECVSFMGAMLPGLKRWKIVRENEERYGQEARAKYGDKAVDETNQRLLAMDERTWASKEELEAAIIEKLEIVLGADDATGPDAMETAAMHAKWIKMHWGENAFSPDAHVALAEGYLADERFVEYYDSRAGKGATEILVEAITNYHLR